MWTARIFQANSQPKKQEAGERQGEQQKIVVADCLRYPKDGKKRVSHHRGKHQRRQGKGHRVT